VGLDFTEFMTFFTLWVNTDDASGVFPDLFASIYAVGKSFFPVGIQKEFGLLVVFLRVQCFGLAQLYGFALEKAAHIVICRSFTSDFLRFVGV